MLTTYWETRFHDKQKQTHLFFCQLCIPCWTAGQSHWSPLWLAFPMVVLFCNCPSCLFYKKLWENKWKCLNIKKTLPNTHYWAHDSKEKVKLKSSNSRFSVCWWNHNLLRNYITSVTNIRYTSFQDCDVKMQSGFKSDILGHSPQTCPYKTQYKIFLISNVHSSFLLSEKILFTCSNKLNFKELFSPTDLESNTPKTYIIYRVLCVPNSQVNCIDS